MKVSSFHLKEILQAIEGEESHERLMETLKSIPAENVAFLLTFLQSELASCAYLPLVCTATPLELFARNLTALETDDRFYKTTAVAFLIYKNSLLRLKGKEQKAIEDFIKAQERNQKIVQKVAKMIKNWSQGEGGEGKE